MTEREVVVDPATTGPRGPSSRATSKDQILPVEVDMKNCTTWFDADEHPRPDASMETMARLKPVFTGDGTVTAGNAVGMNDAPAAVVMERSADRDVIELNEAFAAQTLAVTGELERPPS